MVSSAQETNVEVAVEAFRRWMGGDVDGTLEILDPEIEIYVPAELANTGTYRGHEAFLKWTSDWNEAWTNYEMSVKDIGPLGERHVISSVHQRAEGAGSGIPVAMDLTWLTEVRDGKVVALHLYATEDDARRVGEEREAGA
jgi:ketosteroid isomerase-like protein